MWLKAVDCCWHRKSIWLFGYQTQMLFDVDIIMNAFILDVIYDFGYSPQKSSYLTYQDWIDYQILPSPMQVCFNYLVISYIHSVLVEIRWWYQDERQIRMLSKSIISHLPWSGQTKITRPFKMYQVDNEGLRNHVWIIPGSSTRVRSDPQLSGSDANLWYQAVHWWNEELPHPVPDVSGNLDSTIKGHLK
jgi:hypothetical protein